MGEAVGGGGGGGARGVRAGLITAGPGAESAAGLRAQAHAQSRARTGKGGLDAYVARLHELKRSRPSGAGVNGVNGVDVGVEWGSHCRDTPPKGRMEVFVRICCDKVRGVCV